MMMEWFNRLPYTIRLQDIIDILIVAVLIYQLYKLIKGTRAEQLSKGILVILVLTQLSEWLQLYTINYLLSGLITVGFLAIFIVFQPELRRGLEIIGRSSSLKNLLMGNVISDETVAEIVNAVGSLSRQKIGALIVIERDTGLNEVIETGTIIDGTVSAALLINIFIPNTPLHDGAVIIRDNEIVSAASFLPLTDNNSLSKELGTRHRAAIGVSERSDCFVIIVSEETGTVSIAENGEISRHLDLPTLKGELENLYGKSNISEGPQSYFWNWRKEEREDDREH